MGRHRPGGRSLDGPPVDRARGDRDSQERQEAGGSPEPRATRGAQGAPPPAGRLRVLQPRRLVHHEGRDEVALVARMPSGGASQDRLALPPAQLRQPPGDEGCSAQGGAGADGARDDRDDHALLALVAGREARRGGRAGQRAGGGDATGVDGTVDTREDRVKRACNPGSGHGKLTANGTRRNDLKPKIRRKLVEAPGIEPGSESLSSVRLRNLVDDLSHPGRAHRQALTESATPDVSLSPPSSPAGFRYPVR